MPKEKIFDEWNDLRHLQIHVGWSKDDESVQVSTVNTLADKARRESNPQRSDWDTAGVPEYAGPSDPDGYYVCLDRNSINRLIRTLRRARDQAFGADA